MSEEKDKVQETPAGGTEEGSAAPGASESAAEDTQELSEAKAADQETTDKDAGEGEKEEEKVGYDLLDATTRAGSIVDIKFKVPYSEYDRKASEFYKELRQTVIIDGFRRGKAPLKLIQNRYHKEVKQDTLDFLMENCLTQITKEKEYVALRTFDRVDPGVDDEKDLEFAISLEIRPQVDPHGYDDIQVTVDTRKIDDAAVAAEIEKLRLRHGTYQPSPLTPWAPGCGVTLDIRVTDDKDKEIADLTRKDLFLAHPEHSLPEQAVHCLTSQTTGSEFTSTVPNVRYSEGGVITSEQDTYRVKVCEVKRQVLPELDADFAQDVGGFESVEALREEIRRQLERNEERNVRDQTLTKIYDVLIERNPMDLPTTLVRQMQEEMIREHQERLRVLGLRLEDLGEDPQDYVVQTQKNAERMLKVILLNQAIAKKETVEATDEDVDKAIVRRAEAEGRKPLAIRARLEAHKEMDRFRRELKHDLVEDLLIARAKVDKQYIPTESKLLTPREK